VSIAVFLGGSQVLGVVLKALAKRDITEKTIGEELQVSKISDRLNAMFNHANTFIAFQVVWAHWKRSFIFPLGPNCTFTINL
jgi:predicted Rossmann-fold nucleotide-binding protein